MVLIGRPEAGGVGSQCLVDQVQVAGSIGAEFEFRVGDDDAALQGIVGGFPVQPQAAVADLCGQFPAQQFFGPCIGNIFIVFALFRFRGRGVDGLRQPFCQLHACRQADAAYVAGALIVLPPGTDQVTPDDGFHRQRPQPFHDHGAALYLLAFGGIRKHLLQSQVGEMVGDDVPGPFEPEFRDAGQHQTLAGNGVGQYHIEGGNPVGRDDQQVLVVDGVDVTDLAAVEQFQTGDG